MSLPSLLLIVSSLLVAQVLTEERFCDKSRKLLLGGVFNYDKMVFLYSWKEVSSVQLWLVWRYEIKNNKLVAVGKDTTVDQILPGVPLFRAGFGLTIKCEASDATCNSYRQLVFIFFQTSYRVFRFANDAFTVENDKSKIPWGLKPRGEATDLFFNDAATMDNVNAIMFMSGYQPQIYVVSKNSLFMTAVNIKAAGLKWTKMAESKDLGQALGGFVIGTDLFINKNEAPDSVLLRYDQTGKEAEKVSVWKYFECDKQMDAMNAGLTSDRIAGDPNAEVIARKEEEDSLATILLIVLVVAIVLTDIIVGAFWLAIWRFKKSSGEP